MLDLLECTQDQHAFLIWEMFHGAELHMLGDRHEKGIFIDIHDVSSKDDWAIMLENHQWYAHIVDLNCW